jgi:hypothetical protein
MLLNLLAFDHVHYLLFFLLFSGMWCSKGGIHESTIHGKSAKRKSMVSSTTTTEDMILSRRL